MGEEGGADIVEGYGGLCEPRTLFLIRYDNWTGFGEAADAVLQVRVFYRAGKEEAFDVGYAREKGGEARFSPAGD